MKRNVVLITAIAFLAMVAFIPVYAQYVGEAWVVHQGLQGKPGVMKIGPNGGVDPNEIAGFEQPSRVAVNPVDGSFWVADAAGQLVIKFQANAAPAFYVPASVPEGEASPLPKPESISLNPLDGTAWVGCMDSAVKVLADGQIGPKVTGLSEAKVAVNPSDGSCWITSSDGRVGLYDANAQLIANAAVTFKEPKDVAVDPRDGSAWVADNQANLIIKLNKAGQEIARVADVQLPVSPSVDPRDGSLWVIGSQNAIAIKMDASGNRMLATQPGMFFAPVAVAVDGQGNALIVDQLADPMTGQGGVIKLTPDGGEAWRQIGFISPTQIGVGGWSGQ